MQANILYYSDNLDIMVKYIPSDSIDLIYRRDDEVREVKEGGV